MSLFTKGLTEELLIADSQAIGSVLGKTLEEKSPRMRQMPLEKL